MISIKLKHSLVTYIYFRSYIRLWKKINSKVNNKNNF